MAKINELNQQEWDAFVAGLPPVVKALCEKLPPDRLYRLNTTGQRGMIHSYSEDGTVTMNFPAEFNPCSIFPLQVFGLDPNDIEECDDLRRGLLTLGDLPDFDAGAERG